MIKKYIYGTAILMLIILSYAPLFFFDLERVRNLMKEDGIYQNLQAIFYLLSAGLMLFLFFRSKSGERTYFLGLSRNYCFLLLFLLFFVFFGEEISWGQRIFGFKSPGYFLKVNAQEETNIHNLWVFQSHDKTLKAKTGFERWTTSARLYALIWFIYCSIAPVLNYFSSGIRRIFNKINLPIIPIWLGFLFVLNYLISKIVENVWSVNDLQSVTEVKETGFAFLYLAASITLYIIYRNAIDQSHALVKE